MGRLLVSQRPRLGAQSVQPGCREGAACSPIPTPGWGWPLPQPVRFLCLNFLSGCSSPTGISMAGTWPEHQPDLCHLLSHQPQLQCCPFRAPPLTIDGVTAPWPLDGAVPSACLSLACPGQREVGGDQAPCRQGSGPLKPLPAVLTAPSPTPHANEPYPRHPPLPLRPMPAPSQLSYVAFFLPLRSGVRGSGQANAGCCGPWRWVRLVEGMAPRSADLPTEN